jgi:iron(III) transport system substrate-binding protein
VFLIPNTVAILEGAPHRANAERFTDWLLRPETEALLAAGGSRQIPVRPLSAGMSSALPERLRNLRAVNTDAQRLAQNVKALSEKAYRVLSGEEE